MRFSVLVPYILAISNAHINCISYKNNNLTCVERNGNLVTVTASIWQEIMWPFSDAINNNQSSRTQSLSREQFLLHISYAICNNLAQAN